MNEATLPSSLSSAQGNYYRASFTYVPRMQDEIQLLPGDLVYLIKSYDDGWSKGYNLRTGREGVFPMSFVKSLSDGVDKGKGKAEGVRVTTNDMRERTKPPGME